MSSSNVSNGNTPKFSEQFAIAEYTALRKEIEIQIADRRKIEGQVFVAVFAIYSWLLSRPPGQESMLMQIAIWLPVVSCLLGAMKWAGIMTRTMSLGRYIKILESQFCDIEKYGWEHFLDVERRKAHIPGETEGFAGVLYWLILSIFSISMAIFYNIYISAKAICSI